MKTQIAFLILIAGLTISCNQKTNSENLIGKWRGYENDTVYMEVWFNDSLFLTWRADRWLFEVTPYRYNKQTKLISSSTDNFKSINYSLKAKELNENELVLTNEIGTWVFEKISIDNVKFKPDNKKVWDELALRTTEAKK